MSDRGKESTVNEKTPTKSESKEPPDKRSKFDFMKKISVEPCMFLCGLGFSFIGVQVSTLYIQKTCKVGSFFFGNETFSEEVCDNLFNGTFKDEQRIVQEVTAKVEIVTQILKQIPMVIFSLFLGPWSDKAGRKMLIMMPFLGYLLYCITFMMNVFFFDELVVEFLWLESISSYFGGFVMLFLGGYGYIADTTSVKSRTLRIAIMDGVFAMGDTIGFYINGYIYSELGYYGSFGFASVCFLLGLIIVFFTVQNRKISEEKKTKNNVFDVKNVLESFKVLTKPRPENMRHIVILLVLCFQIWNFTFGGTSYIDYLYVRRKFEWSDENTLVKFYSQLSSYRSVVNIFSLFVILPLLIKVFKLHDISIVMLAVTSLAVKCLIFCFATDKNILYAIIGTCLFDYLVTQPLRSTMTKIVGSEDVGKVFAAVGSLQAMMGFASPLYNLMYIHTLDTYIGIVYLITVGFYTILFMLLAYSLFFLKRLESKAKIILDSAS